MNRSRNFAWVAHPVSLVVLAAFAVVVDHGILTDGRSIHAGAFLPLLRVVQRVVDRRFNRAAYNAQKVVDAFGERLRNGADPHEANVDRLAAVAQTLQPASLGVWSRGGGE